MSVPENKPATSISRHVLNEPCVSCILPAIEALHFFGSLDVHSSSILPLFPEPCTTSARDVTHEKYSAVSLVGSVSVFAPWPTIFKLLELSAVIGFITICRPLRMEPGSIRLFHTFTW